MAPPAQLDALCRRLDTAEPDLARLERYFMGKHPMGFASAKFRETFGALLSGLADNWLQIVVQAVEERLNVEGFRFGDETADRDAWAIWQANALDNESGLAHTDALVYGRAFAMVWADENGEPSITVESPRQVSVALAAGNPRRRAAAVKRWWDPEDSYVYATLYLPSEITRWKSARPVPGLDETGGTISTPVGWSARGEPIANPLGVVPVVPLVNRPTVTDRQGQSEIGQVLGLQDAINKTVRDMILASEFLAFPQRWAVGIELSDDEEQMEPPFFNPSVQRMMVSESSEAKFGQMSAADLGNYVKPIELLVQHLASQTRTPPHYLNPGADRLSGESIKAAETGLVAKVKSVQRSFGESWEEVMRLAFAVKGDPRSRSTAAEAIWADPEIRTESEHVDAVSKKAALGVPLQQLWEDLGYSPQQVERFRTMQRQSALDLTSLDLGSLAALTDAQ